MPATRRPEPGLGALALAIGAPAAYSLRHGTVEGDHYTGLLALVAGAAFLDRRTDVERISAIGFSVGGEMLLPAADESDSIHTVVSEGAGERIGETDASGLVRVLVGGESTRQPTYFALASDPKAIWKVSGASHTRGIDAEPVEYERRVTAFLESALLNTSPQPEGTRS